MKDALLYYEEAMVIESIKRQIPHETKVKTLIFYKDQKLNKEFIADYIRMESVYSDP